MSGSLNSNAMAADRRQAPRDGQARALRAPGTRVPDVLGDLRGEALEVLGEETGEEARLLVVALAVLPGPAGIEDLRRDALNLVRDVEAEDRMGREARVLELPR